MNESILAVRDWTLQRDTFRCGPLDLDLRAGEVTTILGPSGIGKTLTMLTALGYIERDLTVRGERTHRGKPLADGKIPPRALYIPQQSPFNPNWRVRGFLARLPWGNPTLFDVIWPLNRTRAQQVDDVLESLGLAERRNATVAELSGGEIQRAALAQVFLLEPQLLVGDEFISALDPGIALWILEQCREALLRTAGTALFALHDVPSTLRISDRLLLLFPSRMEMHPWEVRRGDAGWHVGIIHTTLCVSRWCVDEAIPISSLRVLLAMLREWMRDPEAIIALLNTYKHVDRLWILRDGSLSAERSVEVTAAMAGWLDIAPVDVGRDAARIVGVSIPRPGSNALQIVIGAGR
ncbi:MAG TPA: ATP-binding cassette domain-containing protein [Thermoanaerobaculia bacterium]